ncbi:MAG: cytochrome c [Gammaproteobacteria bacterium]|nr:cytochrome c [Gammaproteobacteria bacterium]
MRAVCGDGRRRLSLRLLPVGAAGALAGILASILTGILAGTFAATVNAAEPGSPATSIERGRYLVHAGGCLTCHTADRPDAIPLAGGRALKTSFGTFYAPNLTPDPETGLGRWTAADVSRALREGVAPDGSYYYPVFPYPSYTGLTDNDVTDITAYLRSLAPVRQATPEHELPWYLASRLVMFGWNVLNFRAQRFMADTSRDDAWNRGAYLVRHLGHCGECHTPRNALGGLDRDRELAGNPAGADGKAVPDITQDPDTGIGRWSTDDIVFLLETGLLPDGDFAGSLMSAVIDDNTGKLTAADRLAIASYLKSVKPAR